MNNKKILYISQEITPYLPASEMSLIGKNLPQSIQEKGYEVRTFMPKYGNINERRNQLHEVIRLSGMNIIINDTDHPLIIKVATLQPSRMQVYFIDNEDYFQHHAVSDIEIRMLPEDNDERIMFYVRGVVETVKKLRWEPSIIHNVGWITALAPLYLRNIYNEDPSFRSSKIVYSLTSDRFDGTLDEKFVDKLKMDGLEDEILRLIADEPVDYINLSKIAIENSDGVVQLSENVAEELIDFVHEKGIPFLPYRDEEKRADEFLEFYQSL